MYRIIGADDRDYGPVDAAQIRQWLREGRLNRLSRIQAESDGDWAALGARAEFADLFPPLPAAGSRPTGPAETCGLARAALICGVLGVTGLGALAGLALGFLAHGRIRQSGGHLAGANLATAGIVLSLLFLLVWLLAAAAFLLSPRLRHARQVAHAGTCLNHVRQLGLAASMYSAANQGGWPAAKTWCDDLTPYVSSPGTFRCPLGDERQRSHYAFNAKLAGVSAKDIAKPGITVLLLETDRGWNASGGPEQAPQTPRHGEAVVVGFADGHAEAVLPHRLAKLRWAP